MKYFYLSLPITSIWVLFPSAYYLLPSDPTEAWWAIPLATTLFIAYIVVSAGGITKGLDK